MPQPPKSPLTFTQHLITPEQVPQPPKSSQSLEPSLLPVPPLPTTDINTAPTSSSINHTHEINDSLPSNLLIGSQSIGASEHALCEGVSLINTSHHHPSMNSKFHSSPDNLDITSNSQSSSVKMLDSIHRHNFEKLSINEEINNQFADNQLFKKLSNVPKASQQISKNRSDNPQKQSEFEHHLSEDSFSSRGVAIELQDTKKTFEKTTKCRRLVMDTINEDCTNKAHNYLSTNEPAILTKYPVIDSKATTSSDTKSQADLIHDKFFNRRKLNHFRECLSLFDKNILHRSQILPDICERQQLCCDYHHCMSTNLIPKLVSNQLPEVRCTASSQNICDIMAGKSRCYTKRNTNYKTNTKGSLRNVSDYKTPSSVVNCSPLPWKTNVSTITGASGSSKGRPLKRQCITHPPAGELLRQHQGTEPHVSTRDICNTKNGESMHASCHSTTQRSPRCVDGEWRHCTLDENHSNTLESESFNNITKCNGSQECYFRMNNNCPDLLKGRIIESSLKFFHNNDHRHMQTENHRELTRLEIITSIGEELQVIADNIDNPMPQVNKISNLPKTLQLE